MKYCLIEDKTLMIDLKDLFYPDIQSLMDDLIPSKKIQHLLITNGWIRIDQLKVKRETKLVGDKLYLDIYPENYNYHKLEKNNLEVIYEDELLLIVKKRANLLVHSDGNNELTLKDEVESYYSNQNYIASYPIHRLDKMTTGLVIFSKSIIFQPLFDKMLSEKKIRRDYLAFCIGKCEKNKKITIENNLGKDRHNAKKMAIVKNGQKATTKVECLCYKNGLSVFKCSLLTGRCHQIRVHLSSIGYPIINDDLYGKTIKETKMMGLFADHITLYHPLKQENLSISCQIDPELKKLM